MDAFKSQLEQMRAQQESNLEWMEVYQSLHYAFSSLTVE
jgi:hypothetical protein